MRKVITDQLSGKCGHICSIYDLRNASKKKTYSTTIILYKILPVLDLPRPLWETLRLYPCVLKTSYKYLMPLYTVSCSYQKISLQKKKN